MVGRNSVFCVQLVFRGAAILCLELESQSFIFTELFILILTLVIPGSQTETARFSRILKCSNGFMMLLPRATPALREHESLIQNSRQQLYREVIIMKL